MGDSVTTAAPAGVESKRALLLAVVAASVAATRTFSAGATAAQSMLVLATAESV